MTSLVDQLAQANLQLPDYTFVEILYRGPRTTVYRAVETITQQPVVVKVMAQEYPSFSELVKFRNQYTVAKNLAVEGIVHPLSLEAWCNGYALVMEDFGGNDLRQYAQQISLNLTEVLDIAIQLAGILHELHQHRVIHKDIKPANILIHPESKQIKLIDFSIASLLPKETQVIQSLKSLEGTLAYLAPEQTGRMNRAIDYRTDFYALGITLYQLLTGQLPFTPNDPLELIHCHMAKVPVPPHKVRSQKMEDRRQETGDRRQELGVKFKVPNSVELGSSRRVFRIPNSVSDIVLKLMAKNAEDRYQSALGLKHDLEQARMQWQERGDITDFVLGQRDLSDRFTIPEKLFGREAEVQTLLDAFDRVSQGAAELMLVAGYSGVGKTAVVNEVHKPIVAKRGYFVKGKYDQFNRNIPFSAFVQAFRDLMGQLLGESDAQLQAWKAKILEIVKENGQVLIDVIPELEAIIGPQPPVPELSGSAAQNRFNLLFEKFIAVFATSDHPLVMFLDDLQWADSASLNLLNVLIGDNQTGYLLLLGAYRDNEVFPAHPLMLALGDLENQKTTLATLTLAPLSVGHINQLVAETLSCPLALVTPLTNLVYQKTKGNPFFTTQFLKGLHEDGLITFNSNLRYWECDLVQVRKAALTDDVVEFMTGRLQKLPNPTQEILKLAACIGNQFDLETLAIIYKKPSAEVATNIWNALQSGLVLPQSEAYKFFQEMENQSQNQSNLVSYHFLHDRVQQAAYSLIPDPQKQTTHYRIGQQLLQNTPLEIREEQIFALVNHLNYGIDVLSQPDEKEELARLNLMACRKAKSAIAYRAGHDYARKGLSLLVENSWQEQYELTFALTELAAEFAALCGDWKAMERLVGDVVANSHSLVERASVYRLKIQTYTSRNQLSEAIAVALEFLQQLGVTLPDNPAEADIANAIAAIPTLMGDCQVEDLLDLPPIQDPEKSAIVQIAQSIFPSTYISSPHLLFPLVVGLAVSFSIQYGNSPPSGQAYACYGLMLSATDVVTGVKFGQLALQLADKLTAKTAKAEVLVMAGGFLLHRTSPMRDTLPLLQAGYTSALEVGNPEFAGYNAHHLSSNCFWCGRFLEALVEEVSAYCRSLEQMNQLTTANYLRIYWQTTLNLLGRTETPTLLSGEALQEEDALGQWQAANDVHALFVFHTYKLMLCYLFREFEAAQTQINAGRQYLSGGLGTVNIPAFHFYAALNTLAELQSDSEHTVDVLQQVEVDLASLQQWANYASMNHQHKVDLVKAEKCRVLGQKFEALELYDLAIAGAKANEYLNEEALANELAARFYLDWGKEKVAAAYMQEAYYAYSRWGAKAKTDDLEQRYPHLLAPILQQAQLHSILKTTHANPTLTFGRVTTRIDETLDLASLMKAARTLSQGIDRDRAIANLMHVIQENAGAETVALMLFHNGNLSLEAKFTDGQIKLRESIPVETSQDVPLAIVNTVKRTNTVLVLADAKAETIYLQDAYIQKHQPRSILCLPLTDHGRQVGILYLENNQCLGAFTENRVEILTFLCAQAAITLENARLYQQVETYSHTLEAEVERKTQDLHQKTQDLNQKNQDLEQVLRDLKQAQAQLIHTEKMSSLGQMVAGVAHEINNPISFIKGNLEPLESYLEDLKGLLALYQEEYPQPSSLIQARQRKIDPDFLFEDVEAILRSMDVGSDRIQQIVIGLQNFSRMGESPRKAVDIHSGIDSTLLIVQHRLIAKGKLPTINIIREYGNLPSITCYPSQLNQVFLNIINNAIDAIRENLSCSAKPIIRIRTETLGRQRICITITNTDSTISQAIQKRIFEPFFTTKLVGEGTGLGLFVSYSIVQNHGGTLTVHSQPGEETAFKILLPYG
ncbi:MAG: AAA family ATPase [Cyanobacteria bacterium P01_F01_bin.86]